MCFVGILRVREIWWGGDELYFTSCWGHYVTRWGQGPQITILLGWPSYQHIKGGGLPLAKCTTQYDGVSYPTTLNFRLEHKETNKRPILSQLDNRQFQQMNITLTYIHMEGVIISTKGRRSGNIRMCWGRAFLNSILLNELLCKTIYFLESGNNAWIRSYWRS